MDPGVPAETGPQLRYEVSRLREHTLINKRYVIENKLLPFFGEKRINEITVADVRTWHNELIRQDYSPTYLRTINNNLPAIFNFAVRYCELPSTPLYKGWLHRQEPCRRDADLDKGRVSTILCLSDGQATFLAFLPNPFLDGYAYR